MNFIRFFLLTAIACAGLHAIPSKTLQQRRVEAESFLRTRELLNKARTRIVDDGIDFESNPQSYVSVLEALVEKTTGKEGIGKEAAEKATKKAERSAAWETRRIERLKKTEAGLVARRTELCTRLTDMGVTAEVPDSKPIAAQIAFLEEKLKEHEKQFRAKDPWLSDCSQQISALVAEGSLEYQARQFIQAIKNEWEAIWSFTERNLSSKKRQALKKANLSGQADQLTRDEFSRGKEAGSVWTEAQFQQRRIELFKELTLEHTLEMMKKQKRYVREDGSKVVATPPSFEKLWGFIPRGSSLAEIQKHIDTIREAYDHETALYSALAQKLRAENKKPKEIAAAINELETRIGMALQAEEVRLSAPPATEEAEGLTLKALLEAYKKILADIATANKLVIKAPAVEEPAVEEPEVHSFFEEKEKEAEEAYEAQIRQPSVIARNPLLAGLGAGASTFLPVVGYLYRKYNSAQPVDARGDKMGFRDYFMENFNNRGIAFWASIVAGGSLSIGTGYSLYNRFTA